MPLSQERVLTQCTLANNALIQYFQGNQARLADYIQLSRPTVTKFFEAEPISANEFRIICLALRLNCQEVSAVSSGDAIAESEAVSDRPLPRPLPQESLLPQIKRFTLELINQIFIHELSRYLVKCAQENCRQTILNRYSRIRLLNGAEISVDQGCVDVWLLEKTDNQYFSSPESLFRTVDIGKDRLAQSKSLQRYSSIEAATKRTRLAILGKPGSGKTTLLKRLAVDWSHGVFQPQRIAVLIQLRHIQDEKWTILNGLDQALGLNNWGQFLELKTKIESLQRRRLQEPHQSLTRRLAEAANQLDALPLQWLLKQGKFLILMDGLNELPTKSLQVNVQEQLRQISDDYPKNQFILTCRTQSIGAILDRFTSVEVADFSCQQVEQFVQTWFKSSGAVAETVTAQWEKFSCLLARKPALKGLTLTPMQLSLMCWVFQQGGAITADPIWLYKKGVQLLLSQWHDSKQIAGCGAGVESYRTLSGRDKEALFLEIVARQLEHSKHMGVFDQAQLADHITDQLHLANRSEGVAVLDAISTQHGLLTKQADNRWAFPDLTFQEYFTTQWLTQLSPEQLANKIVNLQWQEIVKQLMRSQQPADRLLRLIKQAIEQSIAYDPVVQTFLNWLFQKCQVTQANYKPTALRAFYYALSFNLDTAFDLTLDPTLTLNLSLDLDLDRALIRTLNRALDLDDAFENAFDRALDLNRTLNRTLDLNLDLNHTFDRTLSQSLDRTFNLNYTIDRALDHTLNRALNLELTNTLQQLSIMLPTSNHWKIFYQWWQENGLQWIEQLRQAMITHRNLGQDWQFTEEQTQRLEQHYSLNKFLVDLMDIKGAVSEDVRTDIEGTLLLPWSELQRRQPGIYPGLV